MHIHSSTLTAIAQTMDNQGLSLVALSRTGDTMVSAIGETDSGTIYMMDYRETDNSVCHLGGKQYIDRMHALDAMHASATFYLQHIS